MWTGYQVRMAAPRPSVRPPTTKLHKPSRLPLHRSRSSTDKSSPVPTGLSSVSHIEHSPMRNEGASNGSRRHVSESPGAQKTSQVGESWLLPQGRRYVTEEVPPRKQAQPQQHPSQRRDVAGISPVAKTGQRHRGDRGVVDDSKYALRPAHSPSCGMRMSTLRSTGRQQQLQQQPPQSPTSSVKSSLSTVSDRPTTTSRLGSEVAVGYVHYRHVAKPRHGPSSHYASTSSIDSTCLEHLQHHAAIESRHPPAANATDRQHNRYSGNYGASHVGRNSAANSRAISSSESDEIVSSRSGYLGPPASQRLPAAHQQSDNLQRRSENCRPTSFVRGSTDHASGSGYLQRPLVAVVEPRRRYYHQRPLSVSDIDDLSVNDSTSTINSIHSHSSSGTLTDDDDESSGGSSTTAGRQRRRPRDRDHLENTVANGLVACHASPPPLYRPSQSPGDKTRTKPPSRCAGYTSSSDSISPPSPSSTVFPRQPAADYPKHIQRIGNFGMTPRAPATVSKQTTPPSAQPDGANRIKLRPNRASGSDELATGSRSNNPPTPRRFPSTDLATNATRPVSHSSSVAATVGRDRKMVFAGGSSTNVSHALNSSAEKYSNSPLHYRLPTRQTSAVKIAPSAAVVSNYTPSVGRSPVSPLSKVVDEKHDTRQSSPQSASSTANIHAASKHCSASRDHTRRPGNGTRLQTQVIDREAMNVANGHKSVDKSAANWTMGVMASPCTVKPVPAAVKQASSLQTETADGMDTGRMAKIDRDVPRLATCRAKMQTSSTILTRSANRGVTDDPTAITKRPPPPLKRPSSVPAVMAVGRVTDAAQRRPASTDCSAVSSVRQKPGDVCHRKSESFTDAANLSASIEQGAKTRKPTRSVLNKNDQLTKSYDCIIRCSGNLEMQKSHAICSQMHGSSTSLVDMPPRRLVKPYSVVNKSSTFGRRITALKEHRSAAAGCNAESETEPMSVDIRSSLTSLVRPAKLSDLPEVDEFECDHPMSASGTDRLPTDGKYDSDGGRQRSAVQRTDTITSPRVCPSIRQKPTERDKIYRTQCSIFLSALPPQGEDKSTVETAQVSGANNTSSHRDCVCPRKQDRSDMGNSSSFEMKIARNIENDSLIGDSEPANKCSISAARPTLLVETSTAEDSPTTVEAAGRRSSTENNYVVTYESDNIIVMDREPIIDCMTPDGDVVNTVAVNQLTVSAADGVCAVSGDGGKSRTLPLSESGYDTWKSQESAVVVAGSTCVAAPDINVEQQRREEEDGTLCSCDPLKTFDRQSELTGTEKTVYAQYRESCRSENVVLLTSLRDGDNVYSEDTAASVAAAVEVENDNGHAESPLSREYDRSRRVVDDGIENSARRDAQMFVSICSDAAESVDSDASCRITSISRGKPSSLSSPPDNAASAGLADTGHICFSSQTMPPPINSDISSALRVSPNSAARPERFDEEALNACALLPVVGHSSRDVKVQISTESDNADDVVDLSLETCIQPDVKLIRKTADDFIAGVDDVKELDQHRGVFSKVCRQLITPDENSDSTIPPSSTSDVTKAVVESASFDSYETICDDLLESTEANISDSETSHQLTSMCQRTVPSSTEVGRQPDAGLSQRSAEPMTANDRGTSRHEGVAVASGVAWQPTQGSLRTVGGGSAHLPAAVTGRPPAPTTLRRVRTNFSVVYRQTTGSESGQSAHSGYVESRARSAHEMMYGSADLEPGTVGCRRALAVLASRLDDHSKHPLASTIGDECATSRASGSSVAGHHDSVPSSTAVSLSSTLRPAASAVDTGYNGSTVTVRNNVNRHQSDLHGTQSPLNVHSVASVSAESKHRPISTTTAPSHNTASKKPSSTFRKLLSSKLTSAVRRTPAK